VRIADLIFPFSAAQRLFDHFGQTLAKIKMVEI
jgi:hypothetical protein